MLIRRFRGGVDFLKLIDKCIASDNFANVHGGGGGLWRCSAGRYSTSLSGRVGIDQNLSLHTMEFKGFAPPRIDEVRDQMCTAYGPKVEC